VTLRTLVFLSAIPCLCVAGAIWLLLSDNPRAQSYSLALSCLSIALFGIIARGLWEEAIARDIMARFPGPVEIILPLWARLVGFLVYGGLGAALGYRLPLQRYEQYEPTLLALTLLLAAGLIIFGLFQLSSHSLTLTGDHLEIGTNRRRTRLQWESVRKFRYFSRYNIPMFDSFDGTVWSCRRLPRRYGFVSELPNILNGWRERAVHAGATPEPRSESPKRRLGSLLDYA